MAPPRLYDPNDLLAAGYNGLRGSYAKACRALGWPPKHAYGAKHAADRTIASAQPPSPTPEPASAPAFSLPGVGFPSSPVEPFAVDLVRCERPVAVLSDAHVPSHDAALLNRIARYCKARDVELVIWLGDLLDAAQMHRRDMHSYHPRSFADDLDMAADVLTEMGRWVSRQVLVRGNHERFLRHRLGGHIDEGVLLARWFNGLSDRLTVTATEQVELMQAGQRWRLVHGASSAQNLLMTLQRYAARAGCHTMMGHTHQTATGEWCGWQLVAIAGVHDPARLLYAHEAPRPLPPMTQSWALIERGTATVYRANDPNW
jgi:predicted phosphodiesterase